MWKARIPTHVRDILLAMQEQIKICIVGGGLAGSEAALTLARLGFQVDLYEMRPQRNTEVHHTSDLAELVCSNSLKSKRFDSAAGMLKEELDVLGSFLYRAALDNAVDAGGALAVNRNDFSQAVTELIEQSPNISLIREEVTSIDDLAHEYDAVILATGPLTSDALSESLQSLTGSSYLAFYDAAAPIVLADSIDTNRVFSQSRYEDDGEGDYLNAPFDKEEYEAFIEELVSARRVIAKDFETKDLFQACQPIEEIARKGLDAPRYGTMKPVGLTDPRTGKRPWAAVQLRKEDANGQSYNLVGFQTNLAFPEQERVFRMIPGLEKAEFSRFGVMHRNTFIDAPRVLDANSQLVTDAAKALDAPIYVAGQLSGTEGYCEAIRSGIHCALSVAAHFKDVDAPEPPLETAFGSLLAYSTSPDTQDYQPMHVNFGIFPPLPERIRNKKERYGAYSKRGSIALREYAERLSGLGLLSLDNKVS